MKELGQNSVEKVFMKVISQSCIMFDMYLCCDWALEL